MIEPWMALCAFLAAEAGGPVAPGVVRELRNRVMQPPGAWVLDNLPPERELDALMEFSRCHEGWLEAQRAMDWRHAEAWDAWIAEVTERRNAYWELSMAHWHRRCCGEACPAMYDCLWQAKAYFGQRALETGVLPPVVPLERFIQR